MVNYRTLMHHVTNLLAKKACHVDVTEVEENEYLFEIMRNDLTLMSYIQIYNTTAIIEQKRKKDDDKKEDAVEVVDEEEEQIPCFAISSIYTCTHCRNQHFALLILLYGISFLKMRFPQVNYAKLDEVSSRSTWIKRNIFHLVGFIPQGEVSLHPTKSNELILSGPEKQLCINSDFIHTALNLLVDEEG